MPKGPPWELLQAEIDCLLADKSPRTQARVQTLVQQCKGAVQHRAPLSSGERHAATTKERAMIRFQRGGVVRTLNETITTVGAGVNADLMCYAVCTISGTTSVHRPFDKALNDSVATSTGPLSSPTDGDMTKEFCLRGGYGLSVCGATSTATSAVPSFLVGTSEGTLEVCGRFDASDDDDGSESGAPPHHAFAEMRALSSSDSISVFPLCDVIPPQSRGRAPEARHDYPTLVAAGKLPVPLLSGDNDDVAEEDEFDNSDDDAPQRIKERNVPRMESMIMSSSLSGTSNTCTDRSAQQDETSSLSSNNNSEAPGTSNALPPVGERNRTWARVLWRRPSIPSSRCSTAITAVFRTAGDTVACGHRDGSISFVSTTTGAAFLAGTGAPASVGAGVVCGAAVGGDTVIVGYSNGVSHLYDRRLRDTTRCKPLFSFGGSAVSQLPSLVSARLNAESYSTMPIRSVGVDPRGGASLTNSEVRFFTAGDDGFLRLFDTRFASNGKALWWHCATGRAIRGASVISDDKRSLLMSLCFAKDLVKMIRVGDARDDRSGVSDITEMQIRNSHSKGVVTSCAALRLSQHSSVVVRGSLDGRISELHVAM